MLDFLLQLDRQLFLFLNNLNLPQLDMVMFYISYKFTWIPLYAFLAVLLGIRYRWKAFLVLLFVVLLVTFSDQGSVMFKNYFARLRPCLEPDLASLVHLVKGRCGGTYGFVSSHAANTFAMAVFMGSLFKDRFRFVNPLLLVWATLNAYSRIYLGVHYPGDVIGGALLGMLIGAMVFAAWQLTDNLISKPREKIPPVVGV